MKNIIKSIVLISSILFITSCEKDEGKKPNLSFRSGAGLTSSDVTVNGGTTITIIADASKAEDKDVLKKFNFSKSVNGGASSTVEDKSLSGKDGDNYTYEYIAKMDTVKGQTNKYTFTVTNRDGITNQVELTVKIN
jgi:hypothetical protein